MRCFVRGDAKPKGSKRAFIVKNHAVLVDANKDTKSWQYLVSETLTQEYQHAPMCEPVEVTLLFYLHQPKTCPKRKWPYVKPDVDKLARTILDALTGTVIIDDAQVISLTTEKRYGLIPGVEIEVHPLEVT